ncbi:DUF934 domain-containing protein [Halieaceae bacterium IMCC14734]|uniref:DUF934 domain-containing protein n=1 Tax=Candidatus Litorirhabdus singularis TaxID=2518993 RepID=A0ABT3TGB6_9GAMM|nr:DUF934 domain-containing protein [Candidatus Litorirhabdus singularis]MCX2981353.1 DUF934 domain-containing protein [Candidatus Litorirhabdus singularis]
MPKLIKDGRVVDDQWQGEILQPEQIPESPAAPVAVQLEPGQGPATIPCALSNLGLVTIFFPAFTDGRCFSYARELRESGYTGEIRATGHFIRDQLFYLQRCGFNAFQFAEEVDLDACLASLSDFSESYQAAVDQPEPLFLRR